MAQPQPFVEQGSTTIDYPLSNPFATRFVKPGRLPWIASQDVPHEIESLAQRFVDELGGRGEIVGPHGSGKSTLLEHLANELGGIRVRLDPLGRLSSENESGRVVWLQLRKKHSPLRLVQSSRRFWSARSVLMIDGFEQLDPVSRFCVAAWTRQQRVGLVVTRHRSGWLPQLCHTRVTASTARRIVELLLAATASEQPGWWRLADERQLEERLRRRNGDLREVLMELFDEVQVSCR